MAGKDHLTHQRIVDAAGALFHARGYNDVGVNDVCAQAGVVKGSFYHFFKSKDALLDAVVERNRERLMTGLTALARSELSGRDQLLAQLDGIVAKSRAQKRADRVLGCDIGTLASELAASNTTARKATQRAFREWLHVLEASVRLGMDDGSLATSLDAKRTAASLLAIMQGMSVMGRSFNEPAQLKVIAQLAKDTLLPTP